MTTVQKTSHANFVRQRRSSRTHTAKIPGKTAQVRSTGAAQQKTQTARRSYIPSKMNLTGTSRTPASRLSNRPLQNSASHGYDIAFSLGRTAVHAPTLTIPQLGSRWASGALTILLIFMLFTMWTSSTFSVKTATLHGAQRLSVEEVNSMIGLIGQPVFKAIPSQIESNLRTAFTDLSSVRVITGLPNRLSVNVVERVPVLAWTNNGVVKWIDATGVAFPVRGDVPGLVAVNATSDPAQSSLNLSLPVYQQIYIDPAMVQALVTMAPYVPSGMTEAFDPLYGMGWQDPRGWTVYFGQNTKDIPMKLLVYQAIVDTLTRQGIQPSLISVENLNAPFYK
jgi:hypothetical protein